MNYPLISEYIEAIKSAEDNFKELTNLRPVLGDDGKPVMTSGNFAVVFKMEDTETGKLYALKCFTKEQEGRAEAYHQIADTLKNVDSPYLVSLRFLEKELFVDTDQTSETEFPVLLMDWVEGKTLDKYLRENIDDKYALEILAYRFSQLAQWLIPQLFAHGDLKPDNILVREDGTLVLVDYDGMYVHTMYGQQAREMGSPDFRHPLRSRTDFDSRIDDFPLVSILLSLEAIYLNKHLLEKYGNDSRLLFSTEDYQNLGNSTILKEIFPSSITCINNLSALLVLLCNNIHLHIQHKDLLSVDYLSTSSLEYDEKYRDDDGAMYSDDGKRFLGYGSYSDIDIYNIKDGTIVICDLAFNNYENDNHFLRVIHIPSSVSIIGINPFAGCIGLTIYCDSKWFKLENSILYTNDYSRLISSTNSKSEALKLNPNTKVIGAYALSYCRAKSIELPSNLQVIEDYAFSSSDIELLVLPNVERIGKGAFSYCKSLANVILKGETTIDLSIFDECPNLKHIFVTASKIEYYKKMLSNIADLIYEVGTWEDCLFGEVNFAKEIFELGQKYWEGKEVEKDFNHAINLYELASTLGSSDANKELKEWGNYWFDEDKALYSKDRNTFEGVFSGVDEYEIKEGTKYIAESACSDIGWEIDCCYCHKLTIPKSVTAIGDNPFGSQMREVICNSPFYEIDNKTLYTKGKKELIQCFNHDVEEFVIPEGVEVIRKYAFYSCPFKRIVIPSSLNEIVNNPFVNTWHLSVPNGFIKTKIESNSHIFKVYNDMLYDGKRLLSYWGEDEILTIPNGTKTIEEYAFEASKLIEITLPDSIAVINEGTFYGCHSLMSIVVPKGTRWMFENLLPNDKDKILEIDSQKQDINTEVSKEDLNNVWTDEFGVIYSTDRKYLIEGPVKETQKGVHIWKTGVLKNSYTIPDGVLSICDKAFFDCRYLISIKCPDSLMAIGASAFQNCWDLKEVNLGHNIMKIGNKAFKNCKSLHSIYIPESLTYVAKDSFEGSGLNIIYTSYGDKNRIESMLPNYKEIIEELPF